MAGAACRRRRRHASQRCCAPHRGRRPLLHGSCKRRGVRSSIGVSRPQLTLKPSLGDGTVGAVDDREPRRSRVLAMTSVFQCRLRRCSRSWTALARSLVAALLSPTAETGIGVYWERCRLACSVSYTSLNNASFSGVTSMLAMNTYVAGGVEKTWHQDSSYFSIEPMALVSSRVALDDVTLDNGCLWVVPGSHKLGPLAHSQVWMVGERQDMCIPDTAFDASREQPIVMRAGDCSFHHSLLLHRSGPNRTSQRRRGIATHYMSAQSRWTSTTEAQPTFTLLRPGSSRMCLSVCVIAPSGRLSACLAMYPCSRGDNHRRSNVELQPR